MVSVLSCVVATIALAADPSAKGLPFGIPPAPEDAVIASVAPPKCLFYVNWAGTAAPDAASSSETEKLLAEPEVQEFFIGVNKVFSKYLEKVDKQPDKANTILSAQEWGDVASALLTHPTAFFLEDVKVPGPKEEAKESGAEKEQPVENLDTSAPEARGALVVSLGADSAALQKKFHKFLVQAKKTGVGGGDIKPVKIGGETWYRCTPPEPAQKKNFLTFGCHGKYFVVGVGDGTVEAILARRNSPSPAWLAQAMEETEVPRRTGIIYLNVKSLRDKLLPLAPSQKKVVATLEMLGLDNVESLVATTGMEGYGMIGRTLLALDGKPHGLLDMAADRPLTAKDLEPIPSNALFAAAARVDLDRSLKVLLATYEKAAPEDDGDARKSIQGFEKTYGPDVHRFLSSLGDTWCVYNSPAEGEFSFIGWTAVVSIRDPAALEESWKKLSAAVEKSKEGKKNASNDNLPNELRSCRYAGHEIHYLAGGFVAPALCIGEKEAVMTLNMPAMKAYLTRKDHRSLATQPGVELALKDRNPPAALTYCNSPEMFDTAYPWFSLLGMTAAAMAQKKDIDIDPTFWPSAPSIRRHLRPDITTVERTPHGLQLTSRYSLPVGSVWGPICLLCVGAGQDGSRVPLLGVPVAAGNSDHQQRPEGERNAVEHRARVSIVPMPAPSASKAAPPPKAVTTAPVGDSQ